MRGMLPGLLLMVAPLALGSCARKPAPVAANQSTLPPLPRSSLAAVVTHRAELRLSDDQVRELERLDQQRELEDAAIRAEVESKHNQSQSAPTAPAGTGSGGGSPQGMGGGGMGRAMGGGRMGAGGGMRGGRMGGRAPGAQGGNGANTAERATKLQDRFDDNDTKAYLDGEGVLTEEQRSRAREIASDYREQLYERRELLSQRANPQK
jgi:hypothetical protein